MEMKKIKLSRYNVVFVLSNGTAIKLVQYLTKEEAKHLSENFLVEAA